MSRHGTEHELEEIEKELHKLVRQGELIIGFLEGIAATLDAILARLPQPPQSTTALISGGSMSIPSGGTTPVTLTFVDGTVTPPTPQTPPAGDGSGLVVTIASDNPVVTIDTPVASGDTYTATATAADVTVDTPFNYTATVANSSGAPLVDNDGTTPFVQPAALASSVTAAVPPPAQATTAVLSEG